jgi:dsDNA-binding SOS-regulon protein
MVSAITNMRAPNCIKDVQKLTGCMAALNRFVSKLGEWGLPFFKLLKHQEKFVWTPEEDQALAQLKDFLSKPPVLTAPRKGEQLLLHLAVTTHVVSTAIVVERQEDGHTYPVQRPVYFISEVLSESKARYQPVQKLLALAQLKDFLSKPPVLMAPRKKEQLLLYLAATTHVVSSAIIFERQEDGHAYPV